MTGRIPVRRRAARPALALALAFPLAASVAAAQNAYQQTNLVSDVPGLARTTDPLLVNSWGISRSESSPFWVSNAGTGTATLYNGAGEKQAFMITIPGPGGPVPGVPTGQLFNSADAFALSNGANATFMFASATGTISGWNGAAGTTAITMVNGAATGASYTGIALAGSGAGARLYAANIGNVSVDVFDNAFNPLSLPGAFTDPSLPAGYAPFNVQNVGGSLFVTYVLKDPETGLDVPGAGNGLVNVYDTDGNLVRRLTTGGPLNSPWGLTLAPASFGSFGGALLVGNFGDGTINAFNPGTGALLGQMMDPAGSPIVNEGLWGLVFGNGAAGGSPDILYFAAGIDGETHGLFGSLEVATVSAVPEPATLSLMGGGLGLLFMVAVRRRRSRRDRDRAD